MRFGDGESNGHTLGEGESNGHVLQGEGESNS